METPNYDKMHHIQIWQPRYKDNVCLIATYNVMAGDNIVYFTKAKHLEGKKYYISGDDIKNCPLDTNGKIECYAVPMSKLQLVKDVEKENTVKEDTVETVLTQENTTVKETKMINQIHNMDCVRLLKDMADNDIKADVILTSPPYNTGRKGTSDSKRDNYEVRYDVYAENRSQSEYLEWIDGLFNQFDKVLNKNGVVLWNTSYGNDLTQNEGNANTMFLSIADIIRKTPFCLADQMIWKKSNALPNNVSPNRLTRICENVFVFCRKSESKTFFMNKTETGKSPTGQTFYANCSNFITAPNNDEKCDLNKATFSSDFCRQLLTLYAPKDALVLDPFMGTGTTAVACKGMGLNYIGSELSPEQCSYANERVKGVNYADYQRRDTYKQITFDDFLNDIGR